jgi:hypothetical protein
MEAEQEGSGVQWGPAVAGGLIAGLVLLILPHGSPWAALTFFSPSIMGRTAPSGSHLLWPIWWLLHLVISVACGLAVAETVNRLRHEWAILVGGLVGALFYVVGLGLVSLWWPEWRGGELGVLLANVIFGLVAAAAYRGLLRRKRPESVVSS